MVFDVCEDGFRCFMFVWWYLVVDVCMACFGVRMAVVSSLNGWCLMFGGR